MRIAAVVLSLALPAAVAHADEPAPNPLSPALRAVVWGGICDILQQAETDCTQKPDRCWAKRTSSEGNFEPIFEWDRTYVGYPFAVDGLLSPAAEQSGLPEAEDGNSLSRLTGVATPARSDLDGFVGKLDPKQIGWLVQNIAPKPDDLICGAPASKLYGVVGKPFVAILAGAYFHLNGKGAFKNFDGKKYTEEYYEPKGRYTKMCNAFIGNPKQFGERAYRKFACGFWFRREYAGQRADFVRAFADVVSPFDPALGKKLLKTLPKAP